MNKQQLAALIWNSCDDLRGSISAVEYKDVILGLIFYRFVSEKEVTELKKQDWTEEAMAEELNEEVGDLVDELSEMPAQLGTLKFIKESETKYALYADINYSETLTEEYDDVVTFQTVADFPATGLTGRIYFEEEEGLPYLWNAAQNKYIPLRVDNDGGEF